MAEAKLERDIIIKEGRDLKESIITEAQNKAAEEAKQILDAAKQTIKSEKESAIKEIKEQIVSLSIEIAGKILHQKLSENAEQRDLIEKSLHDIKLN